jgi:hypothetical protein
MYESNPTATSPPPPREFDFWKKKLVKCPPEHPELNHSQMPCNRGSPGSGILAKIKLNKYFKIKKNEK